MRPVLRLATRLNRRTRLTMWAIAFACMLLVGSLSLVDGLSSGVDSVTRRFETGPVVYVHGSDLLSSSIDSDALAAAPGEFQAVRVHAAHLTVGGLARDVVVASLEEHHDGNVTTPFPVAPADAVALDVGLLREIQEAGGQLTNGSVDLTVFGVSHAGLPLAPPPTGRPSLFPDDWAWIRSDLFIAMDPVEGGPVQAVIASAPLDPATVARLGLTPLATVGAVGFAQGSVSEARSALDVLAIFIAASIAVLVYATLGLEVRAREAEIATLRHLGAAPAAVAAVVEGRALFLAILGATLGSALGIVAAHAVVAFAPLFGLPSLITLSAPVSAIALAYLLAALAALLGGIVPTRHAVLGLRLGREAVPS